MPRNRRLRRRALAQSFRRIFPFGKTRFAHHQLGRPERLEQRHLLAVLSWDPDRIAANNVIATAPGPGDTAVFAGPAGSTVQAVMLHDPGLAAAAAPRVASGSPTSVVGVPGDGRVSLTWTAPSWIGGSAIQDYVIQVSRDAGATWATFKDRVSSTTSATVTGLTNGTAYVFRVAAVNAVGTGAVSIPSQSVTPRTVPGAPLGLVGVPGDGFVHLAWTAPASDGGATITDYVVQMSSNADATWSTVNDGVSTATSTTVTGLANGTRYMFRIAAVNVAGTGASAAVRILRTAPLAPTGVVGVSGDGHVSLTWSAPPRTSGLVIKDYLIQVSSDAGATWAVFADRVSTKTSATVTGLTNGMSYVFRAAAVNAAGAGFVSRASQSLTPRTAPGAPSGVIGEPGDGLMNLAWTAPASNGGASLTDYVIEMSSDAGATWAVFADGVSTETSATATGLTNGTSYVFRVAAVNAAGTGAASAASTALVPFPATPPPMPTDVTVASSTDSAVTLSWDDVSGESDYRIERSSDYVEWYGSYGTWTEVGRGAADTTTFTDAGLEEGSRYSYRVIAVNTAGASAPSDVVTTETKLRAPDAVVATVVHGGRIDLNWVDRSSRETNYVVEQFDPSTNGWAWVGYPPDDSSGMTVKGSFAPNSKLQFRICAAVWSSHSRAWSEEVTVSVTTPAYPTAPTSVKAASSTDSSVTLSWDDVSGEGDYRIERSIDNFTWTEVGRNAADTTTFTDDHTEELTWYSYRVIAINAAGASAPSGIVTTESRLRAPDAVVATVVHGGQVDLKWVDRSSCETHYVVEQFDPSTNGWAAVGDTPVDGSGMIVAGEFAPNTNYQFRVCAATRAWHWWSGSMYTYASSQDVTVSVTTPTYPSVPGGLTATTFSDHIRLSWELQPDVSAIVERMTGGGDWATVAEITSAVSSYEDYNLEPSTAYAYRLAFRNAQGTSAFSQPVSVATAAGPNGAAAYRSTTAVFLGWTRPLTCVTGIAIKRATSGSDAWTAIASLPGTATGYTDAAVVLGTSYRYRIIFEGGGRPPFVATTAETGAGPQDSDLDQLIDGEELAIGTDPSAYSTDSDLLGDGFELANGLNPLSADENANGMSDQYDDFDGDGLAAWQEAAYGTSTNRADENGDGRPDGFDSDGDGVSDGAEVQQGGDPASALDNGEAPSADTRIKLRLSVGDPSTSLSEQWALRVGGIRHASATYGQVGSGEYFFDVGKSYPIHLEHQGSRTSSATPAPRERITNPAFSQTITEVLHTPFAPNRRAPPMFERTIVIPEHIALPVMLNISGSVDDDLLLDGQSITDELQLDGSYLDPGPYPSIVEGIVGSHQIGSLPGPFQDTVNGGITFNWNKREFKVACRDTIGVVASINVTLRVMHYLDHDWYANIEATDRPEFFRGR